jgi:predicted ATPase
MKVVEFEVRASDAIQFKNEWQMAAWLRNELKRAGFVFTRERFFNISADTIASDLATPWETTPMTDGLSYLIRQQQEEQQSENSSHRRSWFHRLTFRRRR